MSKISFPEFKKNYINLIRTIRKLELQNYKVSEIMSHFQETILNEEIFQRNNNGRISTRYAEYPYKCLQFW